MKPSHLSLFTGIGGIDLASEWAGFETVGQCEWADYPTKVLEKHWPDVPRWRDIRTLTKEDFYARTGRRTVDLISGGFPCQPFSVAGNQKGKDDERYLWPEMLRVIRELTPRWVISENVPGILHIAAADVVKDMERLGYHVVVFAFEAAAVGARHRRERIFFVANARGDRCVTGRDNRKERRVSHDAERDTAQGQSERDGRINRACTISPTGATGRAVCDTKRSGCSRFNGRRTKPEFTDGCADVSNASRKRCGKARKNCERSTERTSCGGAFSDSNGARLERRAQAGNACSERSKANEQPAGFDRKPSSDPMRAGLQIAGQQPGQQPISAGDGIKLGDWWSTEPGLGGMANGISAWVVEPDIPRVATGVKQRVDRLKCLGNAVVPQQVYPITKAIYEIIAALAEKGE